ncbi:MAG: polysaccharide deacetylase family protein [Hyphomonadaceae bacterium]|nr:polysaccharide deacetylase family protein [Hyphomonadaceae bacterium]
MTPFGADSDARTLGDRAAGAHAWPQHWTQGLARLTPARPARLRLDRPALSITFDGFTASAAEIGGRLLEAHGVRATYYAAAGCAGAQGPYGPYFEQRHMLALAQAGHEIGCAGFSHRSLVAMPVAEAAAELDRNAATLAALGVKAPIASLAYPHGALSPALKLRLPPRILSARSMAPGLNGAWTDLSAIASYPLCAVESFAPIAAALERARVRRGWVVVHALDVRDAPAPHAVTPATLDALVNVAKRAGFEIAPVARIAARIAMGARGAALAWG